ncbi:MAG: peptidylprolyl isomerase [Candidatus Zixiibacteriota bacterium]
MHFRNSIIVLFLLITVIFSVNGCKVDSLTRDDIAANDFPIAIIDSNTPVMASSLYGRMAQSDLLENGGYLDSALYFDTLNAIIFDSLISLEADKVDLKNDPALYRNFFMLYKNFYLKYLYQHIILDQIPTDSSLIVEYYKSHPDVFYYREQVRARHLVISAPGLKYGKDSLQYKDYSMEQLDSLAREKVYSLKSQIDSGADLGNLAYDYSVHRESGKQMGELGYFFRHTYNTVFDSVAFALPEGDISDPFKSPDGWHILQVIDHIDSGLADLTPEIYEQATQGYLAEQSRGIYEHFMDSIFTAAKIVFNDVALSGVLHEVPDTTWAAVINGIDTITFYRLPDYLHQYKSSVGRDSVDLPLIHDMLIYRSIEYVLMQAGDNLGFVNDPDVVKERHGIYEKYARIFVMKGSRDEDYQPPDSLIEQYYNDHADEYVVEKPIYVQHIIVDDSLFGEFLRDQALSGMDFLELARENYPGAEEIRVAAADLGYIGPNEMPEAFYLQAMVTPVNGISHPVKTEYGYHIIKVKDKLYNRSLEQMRPTIMSELVKKHAVEFREQWIKDIFARHKIEYYLDKVKKLELAAKDRR